MSLELQSSKIKQSHFAKLAIVYIRQSTVLQVKYNTASKERQYALRKLAVKLGWDESKVLVNDLDLGKSGASTYRREGFKQVRHLVKSGQAGAVFVLGASRLSREIGNFAAFTRLCYYTNTLIIDEDTTYDLHISNDRATLGFKGVVADLEYSNLVENFQRALELRAATGDLRHRLPTGFVYNRDRKIVLDPRKKVRERVRLFFEKFERLGSALAVVKYFGENKLTIPTVIPDGEGRDVITWPPLSEVRALNLLHSPTYAGTYTHGRFALREDIVSDDIFEIKLSRIKVDFEHWRVVIHDHHPAYITWEQFLKNEQRLKENRCLPREGGLGAPRKGSALLQGRLMCSKCHHTIYVKYNSQRKNHFYICLPDLALAGKDCQSFAGPLVDQAVTRLLLRAFEPAQLTLALQTLGSVREQISRLEAEWKSRVDGARDEAARAERRYKLAADRNKSARITLQLFDEWEQSDTEVRRLQRERDEELKRSPQRVSAEERRTILALAQDIPAVWNAPTTDMIARKKILQAVISRVDAERVGSVVNLKVQWVTGARCELKVALPAHSEALRTDPRLILLIRELGTVYKAREIADRLNEAGHTTKRGNQFNEDDVRRLRHRFRYVKETDVSESESGGDMYTMQEAAKLLGVHPHSVAAWRRRGRFESVQLYPGGPWSIKLTPAAIEEFKKNFNSQWSKLGEEFYQQVSHKVVKAYDDGVGTQDAVAKMFGVTRAFVVVCLRRRRETGSPQGKYIPRSKLDAEAMELIKNLVEGNPKISYRELQQHVQEERGICATRKMIEKAIFRMELQRKRVYL
jgi:DNA invertase Pin-like site-specific DNA recombinase/transposase